MWCNGAEAKHQIGFMMSIDLFLLSLLCHTRCYKVGIADRRRDCLNDGDRSACWGKKGVYRLALKVRLPPALGLLSDREPLFSLSLGRELARGSW